MMQTKGRSRFFREIFGGILERFLLHIFRHFRLYFLPLVEGHQV